MIKYIEGNLLESNAEVLVNTVNTVGIMGKGIALQFKNAFPQNYSIYKKACNENRFKIGDLIITEEISMFGENKKIINFPTKTDWRKPSEYNFIEKGLDKLVNYINENNIKSIAVPPLGAGNGGLNWDLVKKIMEKKFYKLNCEIQIYQPNAIIKEKLKAERAKLTQARAMLLNVLFDLVKEGEFVSEFAAEKITYFLQRFGAEKYFNLKFSPNYYGPYSGNVKHVLYHLNGSYITGFVTKDKKPFDELALIFETEEEVNNYLNKPENIECKEITDNTKAFLEGFYTNYALELLSTTDFIMVEKKTTKVDEVDEYLESWNNRKKSMFSNKKFVEISINNLIEHLNYN